MRFSRYFDIERIQAELDFVDVELNRDLPLFVDAYALRTRSDAWSVNCTRQIVEYFQALLRALKRRSDDGARRLLSALREPNETRLGLSRGRPKGNAIGSGLAGDILESLKSSRAVQTGLLKDLSESELFVEGIGPDRISDLTTNILRQELIRYTQKQCALHGVELTHDVPSGALWDDRQMEWRDDYVDLPVAAGKKVLLVPKSLVRWKPSLLHHEYYDRFVIDFLRMQELEVPGSNLIHLIKRSGERRVFKKDLKRRDPLTKDFLRTFTEEHPEILDRYRAAKACPTPLSDSELDESFDERLFARQLIIALKGIPPGNDGARRYHRLMIGLLEFLFYPNLIYPCKEREIDEGRKRIDISYTNHAESGVFRRFSRVTRSTATEILVECKNYQDEIGNPELDQLAGRFAEYRGWLGMLVCRRLQNKPRFRARCQDTARAGRGYVLSLDDDDICTMLEAVEDGRRDDVIVHLDGIFRALTE